MVLALALPSVLLAAASCGGKVAEPVRPKDPTAANALGGPELKCSNEPAFARPLIIDLDAEARMDLEAAMKKGVAIVSFDCASMRVLSNCSLPDTSYEYAGTTRNERVVQMKGLDELKATMPFSAGKLSGEVQSGKTIDIGLVLVGKRSTVVSKVQADHLKGACEGATHFVQNASIGAFSMSTGAAGKVAAVAELFNAGASGKSESTRSATTSNGSLEACRTSKDDADAPPQDCRAPLRIELQPIAKLKEAPKDPKKVVAAKEASKDEEKKPEAKAEANPCPKGMVWANEKCTKEEVAAASGGFLCDEKKPDECKEQCAKGHAGSCYNYGVHAKRAGYRDDAASKALAKSATSYFQKACDGEHPEGCTELAEAIGPKFNEKLEDHLEEFKKSVEIGKRACSLGSAWGCTALGFDLKREGSKATFDASAAFRSFLKGCNLGNSLGCREAAEGYIEGAGTSKNPKKGLDLLLKGCTGGDDDICKAYITTLKDGRGVPKDLETAGLYAVITCLSDNQACEMAAEVFLEQGKNADALKYAKMACDASLAYCETLQTMYAEGKGTKKDPAKAKEILKKMCDDDILKILVSEKCDAMNGAAPPAKPKPAPKKPGKK